MESGMIGTNNPRGGVRVGLGIFLTLVAAAVVVFLFSGATARPTEPGAEGGERGAAAPVSVKTVQPRLDKDFQLRLVRPADVEAYYRVHVESRVAGEVRSVRVAPGAKVKKDQTLVKIA